MENTAIVDSDLTMSYEVYQSYQAKLRAAKDHLAPGRYRDAAGSAQRAWEYYGEGVLVMPGNTDAEIDEQAKRVTLGLHETEHRRYYEQRTGDSLANNPSWSKLFDSKKLRGKSEHRGKPVSGAHVEDLRALAARGLVVHERVFHGRAGVYRTPGRGVRPALYEHELAVTDLAVERELSGERVLTERGKS